MLIIERHHHSKRDRNHYISISAFPAEARKSGRRYVQSRCDLVYAL